MQKRTMPRRALQQVDDPAAFAQFALSLSGGRLAASKRLSDSL